MIHDNTAPFGGGVGLSVPATFGGTWVNNTIADNVGQISGSEIYTQGFVENMQFVNNIVRTRRDRWHRVRPRLQPSFADLHDNDLFATVGTLLIGSCSGALASGGNISADPQFARERPRTAYRLTAARPPSTRARPRPWLEAPMQRAALGSSMAMPTGRW